MLHGVESIAWAWAGLFGDVDSIRFERLPTNSQGMEGIVRGNGTSCAGRKCRGDWIDLAIRLVCYATGRLSATYGYVVDKRNRGSQEKVHSRS